MDTMTAIEPTSTTWSCCPVCASDARSTWVSFPELEYARCAGCGTVYKSVERTKRAEEFYETNYFHGRKSARDKRFEHRVRKAMRMIDGVRQFGDVKAVLDTGCSFGYGVEAGKRLGLDSAGTDISQYAVDVCRSRGLRAEQGILQRLPFKDAEFDLVMLKHVIEHVPDPGVALGEMRRILRRGGLLLVAVPDLEYWKGLWMRRSYRYFRPDDLGQQHYVYYTQRSLAMLLEANGFEVLANSKAFLRPSAQTASIGGRVAEYGRYLGVRAWQGLATTLHLRRELYFIAKLASPSL